jgi:carboxymethylenebutenolidase
MQMPQEPRIVSDTSFRSGDIAIRAILSSPEGAGRRPAMLIVHARDGLDASKPEGGPYMKSVADRFAATGYVALVPNLFERGGGSGAVVDEQAIGDLRASVAYLRQRPEVDSSKIACIGFCMGGRFSQLLACSNAGLAATVNCYGHPVNHSPAPAAPLNPVDEVDKLACPLLGVFGADDWLIPQQDVEALRHALQRSGKAFDIRVYPGAGHGFFNDRLPKAYRPEVAQVAWADIDRWLASQLGREAQPAGVQARVAPRPDG